MSGRPKWASKGRSAAKEKVINDDVGTRTAPGPRGDMGRNFRNDPPGPETDRNEIKYYEYESSSPDAKTYPVDSFKNKGQPKFRANAGDLGAIDKCLSQRIDVAERAFMKRVATSNKNDDRIENVIRHFSGQICEDTEQPTSQSSEINPSLHELIAFASRLSFEVTQTDLKELERITKQYSELQRRNLDSQSKYSAELMRMEAEIKELKKNPHGNLHDEIDAIDKEYCNGSVSFYDAYLHIDDQYREFVWNLTTHRLRFLCETPGPHLKQAVIDSFAGHGGVPKWAHSGGGGADPELIQQLEMDLDYEKTRAAESEKQNQLKDIEIRGLTQQVEEGKKQFATIEEERNNLKEELEEERAKNEQMTALEEKTEMLESQVEGLTEEVKQKADRIREQEREIYDLKKLNEEALKLQDKLKEVEDLLAQEKLVVYELTQKVKTLEGEIRNLEKLLDKEKREHDKLKEKSAEMPAIIAKSKAAQQLADSCVARIEELERENAFLDKTNKDLKQSLAVYRHASKKARSAAQDFQGKAKPWMTVFERLYYEAADRVCRHKLRYGEAQERMQAAFMAGFEAVLNTIESDGKVPDPESLKKMALMFKRDAAADKKKDKQDISHVEAVELTPKASSGYPPVETSPSPPVWGQVERAEENSKDKPRMTTRKKAIFPPIRAMNDDGISSPIDPLVGSPDAEFFICGPNEMERAQGHSDSMFSRRSKSKHTSKSSSPVARRDRLGSDETPKRLLVPSDSLRGLGTVPKELNTYIHQSSQPALPRSPK